LLYLEGTYNPTILGVKGGEKIEYAVQMEGRKESIVR
jgi:hypothetical protein